MAFDAKGFLAALEEIEVSKGISKETVLLALEEALKKGYKKELKGGDDADVRVVIDLEKGVIDMAYYKQIVEEVEDDYLQITEEDAKALVKQDKKIYSIIDGEFRETCDIDTLRKGIAMAIKSMMKQKFAEAEKNKLLEDFKDKIGTMITGKVEKADENGLNINIGKTSVFLPRKEMIGDEKFNNGDAIKLFVVSVEANVKNGARIVVSRANESFLTTLFVEEIHEIYDGTIEIKGCAREAGKRSKVAVYSKDPNVDPAGACIGQNGSRIQKIVGQLGNGTAKERIDVVSWSENPGLFIIEALKPARVLGVKVTGEKTAIAVVNDDSLSLAIGIKGVNARLAVRLTGYNIDIKTESDAVEEGIEYQTVAELEALDIAARNKQLMEKQAELMKEQTEIVLPGIPEGYVDPLSRTYDEEQNDFDETLVNVAEKEELEEVKEIKVEEVTPIEIKEVKVEEVEEVVEKREVKTTTSLEELEKNLENESSRQKKQNTRKSYNKNKKKDEEEEKEESSNIPTGTRMSIYTEEELREIEEEEQLGDEEEEEIDYDEYDEYYDDDDR